MVPSETIASASYSDNSMLSNTTFYEGVPDYLLENVQTTMLENRPEKAVSQTVSTTTSKKAVASSKNNTVSADENTIFSKREAQSDMAHAASAEEVQQPEIRIPNVITPNGDNINDYLIINGLDQLSSHRLVIYNRQGKVVYEKRSYDNSWQADNLPDGVYYYWFTFEYNNREWMRQGSIHVIR